MNCKNINKIVRSSVYNVLPGAAISLAVCMLLVNHHPIAMMLPFLLFFGFAAAYFILGFYPKTAPSKRKQRAILTALAVVITALLIAVTR